MYRLAVLVRHACGQLACRERLLVQAVGINAARADECAIHICGVHVFTIAC